ncbi:MAG TPA: DUF2950 family protein, partial [Steroidobacteraceae bacterium]|nr:DUF2950 family protein [Steroidobacteraceae bacterium]
MSLAMRFDNAARRCLLFLAVGALAAAALLPAPGALAQEAAQKTFETPQQAVDALVAANRDNDVASLQQILGADAATLISSGDDAQDRNDRTHFVALYEAHHRLVAASEDAETLLVGDNEWPLPIPLVRSAGAWRFDSAAGVRELLYRR